MVLVKRPIAKGWISHPVSGAVTSTHPRAGWTKGAIYRHWAPTVQLRQYHAMWAPDEGPVPPNYWRR